jgi:hypothetical protein
MNKPLVMMAAFCLMHIFGFSQDASRIHKIMTDPKRAENEAKADVYNKPKHVISDSGQLPAATTKIILRKKRYCKLKPSHS